MGTKPFATVGEHVEIDGRRGIVATVGLCPSCRASMAVLVTLAGVCGVHEGKPCEWFMSADFNAITRALERS